MSTIVNAQGLLSEYPLPGSHISILLNAPWKTFALNLARLPVVIILKALVDVVSPNAINVPTELGFANNNVLYNLALLFILRSVQIIPSSVVAHLSISSPGDDAPVPIAFWSPIAINTPCPYLKSFTCKSAPPSCGICVPDLNV